MVKQALNWIRSNRVEFALLVVIVLVGSVFRLYNVGDWMHFGQDEGNVAHVVHDIAVGEDLVALGPAAPNNWSGFNLGPIFYYLLVPFYWLSGSSPAGGAVATALITSASIILVYCVGKKFFSTAAGLSAAALFSVSYLMVYYGRWVWNPNLVPFFILLIFLSLYQLAHVQRNQKNGRYLYVLAVAVGIIIQLHGTALILIPMMLVVYFTIFRPKLSWKKYLIAFAILVVLNAPTIAYDLTHNFQNYEGFRQIITQSETEDPASIIDRAREAKNLVRDFWFESVTNKQYDALFYLLIVASGAVLLIEFIGAVRRKRRHVAVTLILIWLVFPLGSYIMYQAKIPVHYFCIIFPLPFIFFGWAFGYGWRTRWLQVPLLVLLIGLTSLQLYYSITFLRDLSPEGLRLSSYPLTLEEMEETVRYVLADSDGKSFSFVSEPGGSYSSSFEYLFEQHDITFMEQEAGLEYTVLVGVHAPVPERLRQYDSISIYSGHNVTVFSVTKQEGHE